MAFKLNEDLKKNNNIQGVPIVYWIHSVNFNKKNKNNCDFKPTHNTTCKISKCLTRKLLSYVYLLLSHLI